MLSLLESIGAPVGTPPAFMHDFASRDGRFRVVTLMNYESYAVDLLESRYLHYPNASPVSLDGTTVVMHPDEIRFSLESWEDPIMFDLHSPALPWINVQADE